MYKKYVAVIDYGMGNLFSIMNMCRHVGLDAVSTFEKRIIDNAEAIILPGVGAFGDAMSTLYELDVVDALKCAIKNGKPFMGICLGMQLLMSRSEEFGVHNGMDIIEGEVIKFPNFNSSNEKIKVPHIGWNKIFLTDSGNAPDSIMCNICDQQFMYFVHSYFVMPREENIAVTYTDYCGIRYCSGIQKDNLIAFQFHPEKSGLPGMRVFSNFKDMIITRE